MSNDLKPGDICKFGILPDLHIARVEIMYILPGDLFVCRRVNNGSLVLAWKNELQPVEAQK